MSDVKELPKYIKNTIDYKKFSAAGFYDYFEAAKEKGDLDSHKVIFYTTIGMVEGIWLPDDSDNKDKTYETMNDGLVDLRHSRLKQLENENEDLEVANKSSLIPLVNVTLTPYMGGEHNLPFLQLFSDQIVGLSFGEKR